MGPRVTGRAGPYAAQTSTLVLFLGGPLRDTPLATLHCARSVSEMPAHYVKCVGHWVYGQLDPLSSRRQSTLPGGMPPRQVPDHTRPLRCGRPLLTWSSFDLFGRVCRRTIRQVQLDRINLLIDGAEMPPLVRAACRSILNSVPPTRGFRIESLCALSRISMRALSLNRLNPQTVSLSSSAQIREVRLRQ